MWQSLFKNWLMGQARQQLHQAAQQAATGAASPQADEPAPLPKPEVCHVALVFAMGIEAGGLADLLAGTLRIEAAGFSAREGGLHGRRLLLVESGIGAAAAARATEAIIHGHHPRWVISTGFAGGLDDRLGQGDIVMADEIVEPSGRRLSINLKFDQQALAANPKLHVGRVLTTDRVIDTPQEKRALGREHQALAVDMESLAVAEVCSRERIRFLSIRIISDTVDRALPKDIERLVKHKSLAGRLGAAAGAAVRRPSSIKDMWQLKEDALVASDTLARFLAGIIGQLP